MLQSSQSLYTSTTAALKEHTTQLTLFFRYGEKLIETVAAFKNADRDFYQRTLLLENHWNKAKSQILFLGRIWDKLDPEHQQLQDQLLQVLSLKLSTARSKLSGFSDSQSTHLVEYGRSRIFELGTRKKLKYVAARKALDKVIAEVVAWQQEFDPSWFLILKIGDEIIDKEFRTDSGDLMKEMSSIRDSLRFERSKPIRLPNKQLHDASVYDIPFSSAKVAQRAGSSQWIILDPISCVDRAGFHEKEAKVRDIAQRLTKVDPTTFSLMRCSGFVSDEVETNIHLVFKTPNNQRDPKSLRYTLTVGDEKHSLSDRFHLAVQLARAVCSVHTFGLVHKGIRPENILIFRDPNSELGSAFLVGFETTRADADIDTTLRRSDADWEKNLYRHPKRQGVRLQDPYVMQHDIYSLGVCLLEIGLWRTFVAYTYGKPDPAQSEGFGFYEKQIELQEQSTMVKERLLFYARNQLPRTMGDIYARIVEICLTCLDDGNEDFGDESEFQDENDVLVALRFIETVRFTVSYSSTQSLTSIDSLATQSYFGVSSQLLLTQRHQQNVQRVLRPLPGSRRQEHPLPEAQRRGASYVF